MILLARWRICYLWIVICLVNNSPLMAQELLTNGGFESLAVGTSSYVTTGNGSVATNFQGIWQLTFVSSGGASTGSSAIVDTTKNSGSKSLALTITKHTNRNDIRLFQTINNATGKNYVLNFYMRGSNNGDSVVVNVFKSTDAINSNGALPNDILVLCRTSTSWTRYKIFVDLSSWPDSAKRNMRISIRPNTGINSSPAPSGPFPKTYWFDDISFKPYDTLTEFKDIALLVAEERRKMSADSGFTTEATALANDIVTLTNATLSLPSAPDKAIGFNPPIQVINNNPFIDTLNKWAAAYLKLSFPTYTKSTDNNIIFLGTIPGIPNVVRDIGVTMERLHWLLLSPYSNYRYHPELFRRFLQLVYVTSDDYKVSGSKGGIDDMEGTPGSTDHALNDWFAGATVSYGWRMADVSFASFIPATLVQQIRNAADSAGRNFYNVSQQLNDFTYVNRDISYAEILLHTGMHRNNTTWVNMAKRLIDSVYLSCLLPDGAYLYRKNQNEVVNYHGGTNNSLAKIWAVSEYQPAWDCLAKAGNYEPLNLEGDGVGEFYTAPSWKSQWNGSNGISGEPLLYVTESPYLKTIMDRDKAVRGLTPSPLFASFYKIVNAKALPENYVVYDRNIQGMRGRYGRFSFAGSGRNVVTSTNEPGMLTVVGAMKTQPGAIPLNSALLLVHSKVHVRNYTSTVQWTNWGYMLSQMDTRTCVGKNVSAISTPAALQYQTSGPTGWPTNWASFQQWITLPDRLIGVVETFPGTSNGAQAWEIDTRIKFAYGRNGVVDPKDFVINTPGSVYSYGSFRTILHAHDFTTVDTAIAGVLRDDPPFTAKEIVLRYNLANGATLYNYPANFKRYAIIEVRDTASAVGNATVTRYANGNVKGLSVALNNNVFSVFRNDKNADTTIAVSAFLINGGTAQVHYSRGDTVLKQSINLVGNSLTIPAKEQVLLVATKDTTFQGPGWENYTHLLNADGVDIGEWKGSHLADAANNNNWVGGVPSQTTNIRIRNTQPRLSKNLSCHNLLLQSGIDLNDNHFTVNGTITGTGTIKGSNASSLIINGKGTFYPDNSVVGTTNVFANVTINTTDTVYLGNHAQITGFLNPQSGVLALGNNHITLRSTSIANTGQVGVVTGSILYNGSGRFIAERFLNNARRGYRNVSSGGIYSDGSIYDNWQEGATTNNYNPNPGYGMHITGIKGAAGTIDNTTGLDATFTGNPSLWTYGSNDAFVPVTNTKNKKLLPFEGYFAVVRGNRSYNLAASPIMNAASTILRVKGKLNTGSVVLSSNSNPIWQYAAAENSTFQLNKNVTPVGKNTSDYGFTLVGNPYACAIDWQKIYNRSVQLSTNGALSSYYWVWNQSSNNNSGGYVTVRHDGIANVPLNTQIIQPGQSFYIQNDQSGNNLVLSIQESDKVIDKNTFPLKEVFDDSFPFKVMRIGLVKQSGTDTFLTDATVVLMANGNNKGLDKEDAAKYINPSENIAVQRGGQLLSIETTTLPLALDSVPIAIANLSGNAQYWLDISIPDLTLGQSAFLYDSVLKTKTQLKINGKSLYAFDVTDTLLFSRRFTLVFENTTLPLTQIDVQATLLSNQQRQLSWALVGTDLERYQCQVQRSCDGKTFQEVLLDVRKQGNNWVGIDAETLMCSNKIYYRIVATYLPTQQRYYSKVQAINTQNIALGINIYPTVVENQSITIHFGQSPIGKYHCTLLSTDGNTVFASYREVRERGSKQQLVLPGKIASGGYWLQVYNEQGLLVAKQWLQINQRP